MSITRESVLAALKNISDPVSGQDIVAAGITRGLSGEDGSVLFVLEIDPAKADLYGPIRDQAEALVKDLDGAEKVSVMLTGHAAKAPPPDLKPSKPATPQGPQKIPGVDRILAVASGKGVSRMRTTGFGPSLAVVNSSLAVASSLVCRTSAR